MQTSAVCGGCRAARDRLSIKYCSSSSFSYAAWALHLVESRVIGCVLHDSQEFFLLEGVQLGCPCPLGGFKEMLIARMNRINS